MRFVVSEVCFFSYGVALVMALDDDAPQALQVSSGSAAGKLLYLLDKSRCEQFYEK